MAADPLAHKLDLATLRSLSRKIVAASQRLAARAEKLVSEHAAPSSSSSSCHHKRPNKREAFKRARELQQINRALKEFEAGFLGDKKGLQGREWYRHLGVAPGRWLGYGATTLPGLAEALALDQDVERAQVEVARLEQAFETILRTVERGLKH